MASPLGPGTDRLLKRQTRRTATSATEDTVMWDTVQTNEQHLSHDRPCTKCGHEMHVYLPCDDACGCPAVLVPARAA
ncbi:hypothetical protein [Nocardioides bruguierae]|uniref:hypothetical protein n=1 Tax=Nocardioides bruguierae TaxID=2945102 RepID=UPI002020C768|nr:hypothetical protein [Nocardioides bruguierae]MCL8025907.1 hypothetical protein [Nocardioides bruguierae]